MAQPYEICAVIGEASLLRLQEKFGGSYVYIPATFNESQSYKDLVAAVGTCNTKRLIEAHPGERTWVGTDRIRRRRNHEILRLTLAGMDMSELAKRYGLTRRAVRLITQSELPILFGSSQRRRRSEIQRLEQELAPMAMVRESGQQFVFDW